MREQPGRVCLGVMMGVEEETQNHAAWFFSPWGEEKQSDILFVCLGSLCEFRLAFIAGMINCLQYSICSGGERERGKRRAELWSLCSRSVWEAFHYPAFNLMHTPFFLSFSFFLKWELMTSFYLLAYIYLLIFFFTMYLFTIGSTVLHYIQLFGFVLQFNHF